MLRTQLPLPPSICFTVLGKVEGSGPKAPWAGLPRTRRTIPDPVSHLSHLLCPPKPCSGAASDWCLCFVCKAKQDASMLHRVRTPDHLVTRSYGESTWLAQGHDCQSRCSADMRCSGQLRSRPDSYWIRLASCTQIPWAAL